MNMNEQPPRTNEMPEGTRQEIQPLGLTPEQLVSQTFDRANAAVHRWEAMTKIAEGVRQAARKLKGALVVAMVGLSVASGTEAMAQFGPEISLEDTWVSMIPPDEQTLRVPDDGGTWMLRRVGRTQPTLDAFHRMTIEVKGVLDATAEKVPVDFPGLADVDFFEAAMFLMGEIERESPQAERLHQVFSSAIDRLDEIQGRYENDLDPLITIGALATELANVTEEKGIRSAESLRVRGSLVQAFARVGIWASFEFDVKSQSNDQKGQ